MEQQVRRMRSPSRDSAVAVAEPGAHRQGSAVGDLVEGAAVHFPYRAAGEEALVQEEWKKIVASVVVAGERWMREAVAGPVRGKPAQGVVEKAFAAAAGLRAALGEVVMASEEVAGRHSSQAGREALMRRVACWEEAKAVRRLLGPWAARGVVDWQANAMPSLSTAVGEVLALWRAVRGERFSGR